MECRSPDLDCLDFQRDSPGTEVGWTTPTPDRVRAARVDGEFVSPADPAAGGAVQRHGDAERDWPCSTDRQAARHRLHRYQAGRAAVPIVRDGVPSSPPFHPRLQLVDRHVIARPAKHPPPHAPRYSTASRRHPLRSGIPPGTTRNAFGQRVSVLVTELPNSAIERLDAEMHLAAPGTPTWPPARSSPQPSGYRGAAGPLRGRPEDSRSRAPHPRPH